MPGNSSAAIAGPSPALARKADSNPHRGDATIAATAALLLPLALYAAGQSAVLRLGYPAMAIAAAAYLYGRRSPWYVGLVIWLFCASPLVRRLVDFQLGFQEASPVLLAPYVAGLFAGISALRYLPQYRSPFAGPFLAILGCVGYGMVLAAIGGRLTSGAVDVLKWSIGPLIAVHLLSQPQHHALAHRTIVQAFTVACPLMAMYGILQFIEPQPWDADWVANVALTGLTSIGQALPFELRVFGTMHSPGSQATFLLVGTIFLISRPWVPAVPGIGLALVGIALCQYRAIWAGTAIAVAFVLLGGTTRDRLRIATMASVLAFGLGPMIVVPEIQDTISRRFTSLTMLAADESGEDRLNQYHQFFNSDSNLLLGEGLAATGASRIMDGKPLVVIDSGIIEIYTVLGIFAGTAFFAALTLLVMQMFRRCHQAAPYMPLYRGVVMGVLLQLPFGSQHIGEAGLGAWICLGLGLAALVPQRNGRSAAGDPPHDGIAARHEGAV